MLPKKTALEDGVVCLFATVKDKLRTRGSQGRNASYAQLQGYEELGYRPLTDGNDGKEKL